VRRAGVAGLAAIALSAGCVHLRLRDGPGDVDLARPPPAIEARGATLPRPTRDRALVLSPGVLAGMGVREVDSGASREAGLGLELGIYATHIKLNEMVLGNAGRDYGYGAHPQAWGINLGWTPSATRSAGHASHQPSAYVEAQWRYEFEGVAAGVAFTPGDSRRARTAVQVAPMLGPFYGRLQVLLDGNIAFELGVALKIPVVISWGP
jgi:hypothetical protein